MASQLVEEGSASDIADGKAQPAGKKGGGPKYTSRRARDYADDESEDEETRKGYQDTQVVNYTRVDTSG